MMGGAQQSALMRPSTSLGLLIKFEKHYPISLLGSTPTIEFLHGKISLGGRAQRSSWSKGCHTYALHKWSRGQEKDLTGSSIPHTVVSRMTDDYCPWLPPADLLNYANDKMPHWLTGDQSMIRFTLRPF